MTFKPIIVTIDGHAVLGATLGVEETLQQRFDRLDQISRTRALTDEESELLEATIKAMDRPQRPTGYDRWLQTGSVG